MNYLNHHITTIMKVNRLRWFGCIERMDDNRETKNLKTKKVKGKETKIKRQQ
jgi:hypothetical protein